MSHKEFLDNVLEGNLDDYQVDEYLRRNVLTPDQKDFLVDNDYTVTGILNGRWYLPDRPQVIDWMHSVNKTIDGKVFYPEYI